MFSTDERKRLFSDGSNFVIKSKAVEIVKEVKGAMAGDVSPVATFLISAKISVGIFINQRRIS